MKVYAKKRKNLDPETSPECNTGADNLKKKLDFRTQSVEIIKSPSLPARGVSTRERISEIMNMARIVVISADYADSRRLISMNFTNYRQLSD